MAQRSKNPQQTYGDHGLSQKKLADRRLPLGKRSACGVWKAGIAYTSSCISTEEAGLEEMAENQIRPTGRA